MTRRKTEARAAPAPVTLHREGPDYVRAVYLGDIDIATTHEWMLEQARLAREEGVRRFLMDVEHANPDFPPSAIVEEVEHFADNTPGGIRLAYVSSEMRIARHFMMIRAAAFAKGLMMDVFDTVAEAEAWLKR